MKAKILTVHVTLLLCLSIGRVAYVSHPKDSDLKLPWTIVAVENLFGHILLLEDADYILSACPG
jgi:hypothetical protein